MELTWWRVQLLLLASACVCSLERVAHNPENDVICPQALSKCSVRHTEPLVVHDVDCGRAFVCSLDVTPKLCCHGKDCTPCLWSNISLSISPDPEDEEGSNIDGSEYEDENSGELDSGCVSTPNNTPEGRRKEHSLCKDPYQVAICYISAERQQERCKRLDFTMTSAATHKLLSLILVEYDDVDFGRSMEISVVSSPQSREVRIPALKEVCSSPHLKDIKQCKGPRIIIERHDGVITVLVAEEDDESSKPTFMCMKRGRKGKCWLLENNSIPVESITDCMCFQAWKEDLNKARSEYCPFENNKTEFNANVMRSMSVSVAHTKTNDGESVMSWNLTVTCRISAELWLCQLEADGQCREIKGIKPQHLKDWEENSTMLWASGNFVNITSRNHRQLCVKVKVDGKIVLYCQHRLEREYWSLLVLLPLILVCLTIFGVLLLVNKLKLSHSEWDRCHSQDMKGQVLLLHSSATDPQLVCRLGLLLSELGFGVFLDLWNQTELGSLGPAAWLHSKLDHIQKHGGKALLLLCPSTLQRAECYWNIAVEKQSNPVTYSSDTLASALACILADRQKGGAAQRFVLVQLDCHELFIKEELPVLFRGLPLYKLPSQSQGLLVELCLESPNNVCEKLKKMWWIKRARRKLAKGVQNISNSTRARTETMLTQSDTLSLDTEDTEERVFL
ncbi:unnamed protein product [Leuciscus chuanchicus]